MGAIISSEYCIAVMEHLIGMPIRNDRTRLMTEARIVLACYLTRNGMTTAEAGRVLHRDHSTIVYYEKYMRQATQCPFSYDSLLDLDAKYLKAMEHIEESTIIPLVRKLINTIDAGDNRNLMESYPELVGDKVSLLDTLRTLVTSENDRLSVKEARQRTTDMSRCTALTHKCDSLWAALAVETEVHRKYREEEARCGNE